MRYVLLVLLATCSAGCTTVAVIHDVALKNKRNAAALTNNARTALDLIDLVLPAILDLQLVEHYHGLASTVEGNRPPRANDGDDAARASHYQARADSIAGKIAGLGEKNREARIEELREDYPLAARIAFDNVPASEVVGIYNEFKVIVRGSTSRSAKLPYYQRLFSWHNKSRQVRQAIADILEGSRQLRSTLGVQLTISGTIAGSFVTAAESNSSPSAFMKGLVESPEVLGGIANIAKGRTNDPKRLEAIDVLLKTIKETAK